MKMSEHDRRMATERSKEFIKDRERVLKLFKKEKPGLISSKTAERFEEFRRKWDLAPAGFIYVDNMGYPGTKSVQGDRTVTPQYALGILSGFKEIKGNKFGGLSYISTTKGVGAVLCSDGSDVRPKVQEHDPIEECSPQEFSDTSYEDEDWCRVHWRINLNKPEKELRADFIKKIKELKQRYTDQKKKTERTAKKIIYDKWEIWDLHHKLKLNLSEIVRKKTGKDYGRGKRSPAYNEKLWSPYGHVNTALEQAEKMIKTVEEDAHRRIRKTKEHQEEFQDLLHKIGDNVRKFRSSKLNPST
jgi:hypothetical protein